MSEELSGCFDVSPFALTSANAIRDAEGAHAFLRINVLDQEGNKHGVNVIAIIARWVEMGNVGRMGFTGE